MCRKLNRKKSRNQIRCTNNRFSVYCWKYESREHTYEDTKVGLFVWLKVRWSNIRTLIKYSTLNVHTTFQCGIDDLIPVHKCTLMGQIIQRKVPPLSSATIFATLMYWLASSRRTFRWRQKVYAHVSILGEYQKLTYIRSERSRSL